jgi:PKHD-type hydroxylase
MLLHIPQVLNADELAQARSLLADAAWVDGRNTAGVQAAPVKHNQQLSPGSATATALQTLALGALDRHPLFFSAALPKRVLPPMFNRYGGDTNPLGHYGDHVDQAIRHIASGAHAGQRVRSDLSCTLFLAEPAEYDGGELVISVRHLGGDLGDGLGCPRIKLPAGDAVLYSGSSVHRVDPVSRGQRLASFLWIESLVRSDEQRRLLFDMDLALMRLRSRDGESAEAVSLTGTYHNLLRLWADT